MQFSFSGTIRFSKSPSTLETATALSLITGTFPNTASNSGVAWNAFASAFSGNSTFITFSSSLYGTSPMTMASPRASPTVLPFKYWKDTVF